MAININAINWHDSRVHTVIQEIESSTLTFEVDYPSGKLDDAYSKARIIFEDVAAYHIQEGPSASPLVILDATMRDAENGRSAIRMETSWGYREIECKNVRVEGP